MSEETAIRKTIENESRIDVALEIARERTLQRAEERGILSLEPTQEEIQYASGVIEEMMRQEVRAILANWRLS